MEIISAFFAGLVIREGFGKLWADAYEPVVILGGYHFHGFGTNPRLARSTA
jgi:hypothetical protein